VQDNNNLSVATANEGGTASHQPSQGSAVSPSVSMDAGISSRGRVHKMSRAMAKSASQQEFYGRDKMYYMVSQAICKHDYDCLHDSILDLQGCMRHPIAFLTKMMGDIIYLHQALCQPDARQFMEAVIKETNGHIDNEHWKLIPCAAVPEDTEVVPPVWAIQRKQDLTSGAITKAQGQAQPSRWETRIWQELLKYLRACCHMVCHPTPHCLWHLIPLVPTPS
jgi:hypothetical protein